MKNISGCPQRSNWHTDRETQTKPQSFEKAPAYASPKCLAQTAILYAPTLEKNRKTIDSLLTLSCRFAVEQPELAIQILEKENIFVPGMLTPESIKRCKIDYKTASEAQENILRFLQLIKQYEPKALGGKMPDEKFYK